MSARPAPVRRLERAALAALAAASAHDAEGLDEAGTAMAAMDPEMVRSVLGHALVGALQATNPAGLDGEEVAAVLTATVEGSAPWWPVDPEAVLAVLLGALGAHVEDAEPLEARDVAVHAALVVAEVLTSRGATETPGAGPAKVDDRAVVERYAVHLHAALDELERAQSVEMP